MVNERDVPALPPKGVAEPVFDDRASGAMSAQREAINRPQGLTC